MNIWHVDGTKEVQGAHGKLTGDLQGISGDCTHIWGQCRLCGEISGLKGCITGLIGSGDGLLGDVSRLGGDISQITGTVHPRLLGDVSGLRGDVSKIWGRADSLKGQVQELLDQGVLWPANEPLKLEMFASRYHLPMEFLDNSGSPSLIAFHAVENMPLHWVTVRRNGGCSFLVGPLSIIAKRFAGQEIIKVAVPGDANWQISEDLVLLRTDKVFAFEHLQQMVSDLGYVT